MSNVFSNEEIKMLAELAEKMDSGEVNYVVSPGGRRLPYHDDLGKEFGLECGQAVSHDVILAMTEFNISHCRAKVDNWEMKAN